MRIPPYYKNRAVQRFFAGMVIGGVISWCIFVFIFGVWQERYSSEIKTQKATIEDLEREKKIWQEEFAAQNKTTEEKLTVENIVVKINNTDKEKYDIKPFNALEMEDAIKEDLSTIIAKDLDMVYKSRALLKNQLKTRLLSPIKNVTNLR